MQIPIELVLIIEAVKLVLIIEAVNLIPQIPMVVYTAQYQTHKAQIEISLIIIVETIGPTKVT
jgi:hypothetical protein